MTKVPVRFARIDTGGGKSQLVAVIQGADSISMAVNQDSRGVVKEATEGYNRLIKEVAAELKELRPDGPAMGRLKASALLTDFVGKVSGRFELIAFPESLARDLSLKAGQNEANALLSLAPVVKRRGRLGNRINWRIFIFVHPALEGAPPKAERGNLIGDLIDIIDKQAALAYRGNSFAAGKVSRDLFELALKHHLEEGIIAH